MLHLRRQRLNQAELEFRYQTLLGKYEAAKKELQKKPVTATATASMTTRKRTRTESGDYSNKQLKTPHRSRTTTANDDNVVAQPSQHPPLHTLPQSNIISMMAPVNDKPSGEDLLSPWKYKKVPRRRRTVQGTEDTEIDDIESVSSAEVIGAVHAPPIEALTAPSSTTSRTHHPARRAHSDTEEQFGALARRLEYRPTTSNATSATRTRYKPAWNQRQHSFPPSPQTSPLR